MASLHDRIAEVLGWSVSETTAFSLLSLRELVRPVSPKLTHEINLEIAGKGYVAQRGQS